MRSIALDSSRSPCLLGHCSQTCSVKGAKKSIPIDEGEWAWVKARKRSCPVPQLEAARARMVSRQSGVGVNCRRDQSEPGFELCLRWLAEIIRHMLPSIDHGPGEVYDVPPLLRLCLHEDLEVCSRVGDHLASALRQFGPEVWLLYHCADVLADALAQAFGQRRRGQHAEPGGCLEVLEPGLSEGGDIGHFFDTAALSERDGLEFS